MQNTIKEEDLPKERGKEKFSNYQNTVNSFNETITPVNSLGKTDTACQGFPEDDTNSPSNKASEKAVSGYYEHGNYIANLLATKLDDPKSLPYYKILVRENDASLLLDILGVVKNYRDEKKLRIPPAKFFMVLLKKKGITTKFKIEHVGY